MRKKVVPVAEKVEKTRSKMEMAAIRFAGAPPSSKQNKTLITDGNRKWKFSYRRL